MAFICTEKISTTFMQAINMKITGQPEDKNWKQMEREKKEKEK